MMLNSIKLNGVRPHTLIAEAKRLLEDANQFQAASLAAQLDANIDPECDVLWRHVACCQGLAALVAKGEPVYSDNYDGVSKLRRLTWRERLTGRVSV